MCPPASGAAIDIVGILQASHSLLESHDLESRFLILLQCQHNACLLCGFLKALVLIEDIVFSDIDLQRNKIAKL